VRKSKIGIRAALVVTLITAGALAAGVGVASIPAGASPHAPAHALAHLRAHAGPAMTELDLTDLTLNTLYTCVGPCASATYFSGYGVARSGVTTYGWSEVGTVTSVEENGCLVSSIHEALTAQSGPDSGDAIYFSTASDLECPTADPNVYTETAPFTITGGTGAFTSATGKWSYALTVLASPQIGWGTITAFVTY
jgi:hypothetical protein